MLQKLQKIFLVFFDVVDQILNRSFAFVSYWEINCNIMSQYISYLYTYVKKILNPLWGNFYNIFLLLRRAFWIQN
jgi:hypothetical protein